MSSEGRNESRTHPHRSSLRTALLPACVALGVACSDNANARIQDTAARDSAPGVVVDTSRPVGTLATAAREQPDSVRDQIAQLLRLAAAAPAQQSPAAHLTLARRLAYAYAAAWEDSFFVTELRRFERATAAQRAAIVAADSLRQSARVIIGQQGVAAALPLWRESLRLATLAGDSAGRAASLAGLGGSFYMAGDLDSATVHLEQGLRIARPVEDYRTIGNVLGMLGSVSKDQGNLSRATALYEEASAIRLRSGDSRGLAADQNNLGLIAQALGDLDGARLAFERALVLNRSGGRDRLVALNLTNLGDLASVDGDYQGAQAYYDRALELNRSAGDEAETGFVLHDLGLLAIRRGDYAHAVALLSRSLVVHERSGAMLEALAVRGDLAGAQLAIGDLEGAHASLKVALGRTVAGALNDPGRSGGFALARANLLVQLGAFDEADREFARAERHYQEAQHGGGRAAAQEGRALLQIMREDYAGALHTLELAGRGHAAERDRRSAALTQLLVGEVYRLRGDTAAARRTLTAAHRTLDQLGDVAGSAAALSALGDLSLQHGAVMAAEAFYRRALRELGNRRVAELRWRLHAGLGMALRNRGALAAAAEELRASIDAIEATASTIAFGERRAGFLSDKWEPYAALVRVERELGRAPAAFAVSERMRARQLLATLDRARASTHRAPSEREQDLRRLIGELTREIEGVGRPAVAVREPGLASRPLHAAREALAAAQKEYAALLRELRESDPSYASIVAPQPVDWHDVARRLQPDVVLLQYLVTDSGSTVFVITSDTVAALDLNISRRELANLTTFARGMIDRRDASPTAALWRAPLRRLHQHLIEPVERMGLLRSTRVLVIVPHAELHFVPFGALIARGDTDRFLIERFQLVTAPSASVWVRRADQVATRRRARVLAMAPRTDRLPASRDEVRGIRAVYGTRATVLTGRAATKRALYSASATHDVLHLASYGVLNRHNPLFSYVELASSGNDDGRLEVHDLFNLRLSGQLVVLSACQTALGSGAQADVPQGDDWVGLMQGFLQAGAGGVLASLWPVEDRATARLMQKFYRRLSAGDVEAAALARAQRELLRDPRTAHPFYWAGFTLSGSRGN